MQYKEILKLAKQYVKERGYSIVKPAGQEGGWYYFAYSRPNLPQYGSLPSALRIDFNGNVEELRSFILRQRVSNMAYALENS